MWGELVAKVVGVGATGIEAIRRIKRRGFNDDRFQFIAVSHSFVYSRHLPSVSDDTIAINCDSLNCAYDISLPPLEESRERERDEVRKALTGADMVIIIADDGEVLDNGVVSAVADIACEDIGAFTVVMIARHTDIALSERSKQVKSSLAQIKQKTDSLIVVPCKQLPKNPGNAFSHYEAIKESLDDLCWGFRAMSDYVLAPGMLSVDYADLCHGLRDDRIAMMGIGTASGKNRVEVATRQALFSALAEIPVRSACRIMGHIVGTNVSLEEVDDVTHMWVAAAAPDAAIIYAAFIDETLDDELCVTVIAAGLEYGGESEA
jgi:cell division protein FtsZ